MVWNWQLSDWPYFSYDNALFEKVEAQLLQKTGFLWGAFSHINLEDQNQLRVDLMSNEALKTSEIEGEHLNRESLQSSIRRQFGLATDNRKIPIAEQGMASMMVDLYKTFDAPLTHDMLFSWHTMVMNARHDLHNIGSYRTHTDPMEIVSGPYGKLKIHFVAPPSERVMDEMDAFIEWFNHKSATLPALIRASIAHLYFVSIHPFEDGNGRIGRTIVEKSLSQSLGQPTLFSIADTIEREKKAYYSALETASHSNEITPWVVYFSQTILAALAFTRRRIDFAIEKGKLYERLAGALNDRQEKVLARVFKEGPDGFKGGLTAEKYISITGASRATATRDLQVLVDLKALVKTGELKGTRYHLTITI
jgi:Fic family protein